MIRKLRIKFDKFIRMCANACECMERRKAKERPVASLAPFRLVSFRAHKFSGSYCCQFVC